MISKVQSVQLQYLKQFVKNIATHCVNIYILQVLRNQPLADNERNKMQEFFSLLAKTLNLQV